MKFANLVVKAKNCRVGEVVRISNSPTVIRIVQFVGNSVQAVILPSNCGTSLSRFTNVHREVRP